MVEFSVILRDMKQKNKTLRQEGRIPGIVYGGKENFCISASIFDLKKVLDEAGRSNLVQLNIEGKKMLSLVKDFQLHPLTDEFIHFDLLEVSEAKEVRVQVPLEYKGTPKGVKEGGILEILQDRVEVACKAKDIPSSIEVDITGLDLGFSIHLKDLTAPKNSRFTHDPSTVLVVIAGEVDSSEGDSAETK